MLKLGEINDRIVLYIKVGDDENWYNELPTSNWLIIPIADEKNIKGFTKLAEKCIEKNLIYMCGLGKCCEVFDDIFDEVDLVKKILNNENTDAAEAFEDSPITTWHNNFAEGFWFAVTVANYSDKIINKVVCVDFTSKGVKNYLAALLVKLHQGWLPSSEESKQPEYDS